MNEVEVGKHSPDFHFMPYGECFLLIDIPRETTYSVHTQSARSLARNINQEKAL